MKLLLPLLFLVGVGLIGFNLWKWVWISSVERDQRVSTIWITEIAGADPLPNRLMDQFYQVAYGRLNGLWGDRLLYGCALVAGVVEGCWLRRRLENKGYHMRLWISAQACIVIVVLGGLVLVTLSVPLQYRMAAAGLAAVFAWFGFAVAAGFPRTL